MPAKKTAAKPKIVVKDYTVVTADGGFKELEERVLEYTQAGYDIEGRAFHVHGRQWAQTLVKR